MLRKNIIPILVLTAILFCLSLFYAENNICCMFAGNRQHGFPCKVLLLSKETDSLEEAQKVYFLSDTELLRQGWKPKFASMFDRPPILGTIFNFVFYFVISWGFVFIFETTKRIIKRKLGRH